MIHPLHSIDHDKVLPEKKEDCQCYRIDPNHPHQANINGYNNRCQEEKQIAMEPQVDRIMETLAVQFPRIKGESRHNRIMRIAQAIADNRACFKLVKL